MRRANQCRTELFKTFLVFNTPTYRFLGIYQGRLKNVVNNASGAVLTEFINGICLQYCQEPFIIDYVLV